MTTKRIEDIIAQSSWFKDLPCDAQKKLAGHAKIENFKKDSFIHHIGDHSKTIFCILSGRVRISVLSSQGQQYSIDDCGPYEWLGESGLISSNTQISEVQFKEAGQALSINCNIVLDVGKDYPIMYYNILKDHVHRTRGVYQVLRALVFHPLKSRLAGRVLFMIKNIGVKTDEGYYLDQKLNQQDFASFSHGSRQRVNQILKVWDKEGIMTIKDNRYFIRDIDRLKQEV
jgi:CRP/FNR family cyclic AMP-dependent transcriptional regulator